MRSPTAMHCAWFSLQPDSPRERWPLCTMAFAGCLWISFRSHLDVFSQLAHGTSGFVWYLVTEISMLFNLCDQRCTLFRSYWLRSWDQRWSSQFPGQGSLYMSYTWGVYKWGYPEIIHFKRFPLINHPFWGTPLDGNHHTTSLGEVQHDRDSQEAHSQSWTALAFWALRGRSPPVEIITAMALFTVITG